MKVLAPAVLLVSLLNATVLAGAETPSIGRGIAADKLYQVGDVDSVDLQSGALSVAIHIGNRYPVSEHLSYQFTLHGTSRVWDYVFMSGSNPPRYKAYVNRRSNAGIGWSLHLGRLIPPADPVNPTGTTEWKYLSLANPSL